MSMQGKPVGWKISRRMTGLCGAAGNSRYSTYSQMQPSRPTRHRDSMSIPRTDTETAISSGERSLIPTRTTNPNFPSPKSHPPQRTQRHPHTTIPAPQPAHPFPSLPFLILLQSISPSPPILKASWAPKLPLSFPRASPYHSLQSNSRPP